MSMSKSDRTGTGEGHEFPSGSEFKVHADLLKKQRRQNICCVLAGIHFSLLRIIATPFLNLLAEKLSN